MSSKIHNRFVWVISLIIAMMPSVAMSQEDVAVEDSFESQVIQLQSASYSEKKGLIKKISKFEDPRKLKLLTTMMKGKLYFRKSDKRIVYRTPEQEQYRITDALSDEDLGLVASSKIKKVRVNNSLRILLRTITSKLSLTDADAEVRLTAVNNILNNINQKNISLLQEHLKTEKDSDIQEAIATGVALLDVLSDDKATKLQAITVLSESLQPIAKVRLSDIIEKNEAGDYVEQDAEIRKAAHKGLENIESKLSVFSFLETLFFGVSLGSVLLLIAIGLAITFGVMGVINMAHGELMMLGAYTTYLVQQAMPGFIEYSLLVSVPAAFVVSGLFGVAIERGVIRHLYGRPLETLLATFGISLILQQLVRTAISAQNVAVQTPSWMSGSLQINEVFSLTYTRLYVIVFSIIVFLILLMILKKTVLGLQVRAVSQNRAMAKAMGIRSEWVDALTFGLGSGVAGVAGVALSQLTNVGPNLGQTYIIDSFMVVVFGGVGNLWGTFVSAMSLGVFNKFIEPATGAVLAKVLVLVLIILFIQKRPRGLFPQKGRAVEH